VLSRILYKREIDKDPAAEAKLVADYRAKFASPCQAAGEGMIMDVIRPAQTRAMVAMALRNTLSKRETRPPKKWQHTALTGNALNRTVIQNP
jgi:propionyl-CoA carboxylase beta chain